MKAAALEDSHADWLADAADTIRMFARNHDSFTAEDLRKHMRPAPSTNLPGIAFSIARKRRIITTVGYRQSTTVTRKHGIVRVWAAVKEES